jgi:subtilisin family serine protease
MVWPRKAGRDDRGRHRPRLEALEQRALLTVSATPTPEPTKLVGPVAAGVTVPSGVVNFDQIIGASAARAQYGVDGTGMTVATIDTGVDYNNEDLGDGFGPGHKVIAGYDFADGTANPIAVDQHGTAVAGLIAGDDPNDPGVAPGADIVALRVFDNSGNSSFNEVAQALQWVVDNHSQYNITVVNMSISDGNNYTSNWLAQDGGVGEQITGLIGQLAALNIPVVAAAGNNFSGQQGMGFTAIVPQTISVTSTDGSGHLVANAQRLGAALGGASATDLAAPGDGLYAPAGDGTTFSEVDGTSFAAPLVSGSIVLLQQIYEQRFGSLPTVTQLDNWLQQGSDPIQDPTTGITIGQLDIPRAAALVPNPIPINPPPPAPTPAPSVGSGNGVGSSGGSSATPTPPPITAPAGSTTGTGTGTGSGTTTPATVSTEVYLNGQDLGAITSKQADGGWSAFVSLFTGGVTSIQTWSNGGSAASTPSPFPGATLSTIQQWTNTPSSAPASSPAPEPSGVLHDAVLPAQTGLTVQIPKVAAHVAAHHAKPTAVHHLTRAWDAGFAGHRRHR